MAGHSKFKNIQHRKGAQDKKRAKIFTRLIKELAVAARSGTDPNSNPRLRGALLAARAANMPKDNFERVLKKAEGGEGEQYEEIRYEGYGVGGTAFIVEAMTDNRNRTAGDVRHAFTKRGGNLGTDGSVAYLFNRIGQINYSAGVDEDALMDAALEAGAEDIVSHDDGSVDVQTSFGDFLMIKDALIGAGLEPAHAEIAMVADISVPLDLVGAEKLLAMIDSLEDLDDVQNVYTNAEIPDDVVEQLG